MGLGVRSGVAHAPKVTPPSLSGGRKFYDSRVDEAEWETALFEIRHAAPEIATLSRCLDVDRHLVDWRRTDELLPGTLASDALDQALGLLEELAHGRAEALAAKIRELLVVLPPSLH